MDNIEIFLAVVRAGTFSAAARNIHVSPSNISHRLRALEEEVQCRLIIRGRGVQSIMLTHDGVQFLALAEQMERIQHDIAQFAHFHHELRLTIGATDSVHEYVLRPLYSNLNKIRSTYPLHLFTVTSRYDELYRRLTRSEIDVAFVQFAVRDGDFDTRFILSEEMVIVHSEDLASQARNGKMAIEILGLEGEVYVDWSPDFRAWHQIRFGQPESPYLRVDAMNSLRGFLRAPHTWAIAPRSVADTLSNEGFLISDVDDTVPPRQLYRVQMRQRAMPKNLAVLNQCLDALWP